MVETERLRTKSLGSIEKFINRKRDREEEGSSKNKEEVGSSLKN